MYALDMEVKNRAQRRRREMARSEALTEGETTVLSGRRGRSAGDRGADSRRSSRRSMNSTRSRSERDLSSAGGLTDEEKTLRALNGVQFDEQLRAMPVAMR